MVPVFSLSSGALRWPERELSAGQLIIKDSGLDLVRLEDGALDFARPRAVMAGSAEALDTAQASNGLGISGFRRYSAFN